MDRFRCLPAVLALCLEVGTIWGGGLKPSLSSGKRLSRKSGAQKHPSSGSLGSGRAAKERAGVQCVPGVD